MTGRPTRLLWPALLIVAMVCAAGLSRLRPDTDLLGLTPDVPGREALIEALGAFGLQAPMYLHVHAQQDQDADALVELLGKAEAALLAEDAVAEVLSAVDPDELDSSLAAVIDVAPLLVNAADPVWRQPETIRSTAEAAVAQLAQPGGASSRKRVLDDPYGWGTASMKQLGLGELSRSLTMHRGRVVASSLDAGFVAATAVEGRAVDALEASRRVAEALRAEHPGWGIDVAGPGAQAAAGEATVRGDIVRSLWLSCTLLGFLFLIALRHPLAPVWMVAPAGLAVAGGIGLFGWTGWGLHSLSLAFASALLGLCVDFPIHLAAAVGSTDPDRPVRGATADALRSIAAPAAACALTSTMAFFLLLGSTSPFLREVGLMGGVCLALGALLGTGVLAWGASAVSWRLNRRSVVASAPKPASSGKAVGAAVVVFGLAGGLPFLTLDGDPRALQRPSADLERAEAAFAADFGESNPPAIVFLRADDEATVLEHAHAAAAALRSLEVPPPQVLSATDGLPPRSVATHRCRSLRTVDVPAWSSAFDAAAIEAGLRPGVFEPAFAHLAALPDSLCPGDAQVDLSEHPVASTSLLGTLRERFVRTLDDGAVASLLVTPPDDLDAVPPAWRSAVAGVSPTSSWVFIPELSAHAGTSIGGDVVRLGSLALLLCFGLLSAVFRSPKAALLALLTPALALAATVGAFGWIGLWAGPMPAVGLGACVLVLGLGIDDGVYVVHALKTDPARMTSVRRAVVLTTITSLIGFGVLAFARSPGLAALGQVAAVGLVLDLVVALYIVPALHQRLHP
jgi:predicted exporter